MSALVRKISPNKDDWAWLDVGTMVRAKLDVTTCLEGPEWDMCGGSWTEACLFLQDLECWGYILNIISLPPFTSPRRSARPLHQTSGCYWTSCCRQDWPGRIALMSHATPTGVTNTSLSHQGSVTHSVVGYRLPSQISHGTMIKIKY